MSAPRARRRLSKIRRGTRRTYTKEPAPFIVPVLLKGLPWKEKRLLGSRMCSTCNMKSLRTLFLSPVDIQHDLEFFYDVFDLSLKNSLGIDIEKWNMKV